MPGREGNTEKGKGRGQAAERKRSPLHLIWKRGRARSAKVHACGAEIDLEFQEISGECEGIPKMKDTRAAALEARCGNWWTAAGGRKKLIGKAAASVPGGWKKKETKIMKENGTESKLSRQASQNRKGCRNGGVDTAANGPLKALTPTWRTPA